MWHAREVESDPAVQATVERVWRFRELIAVAAQHARVRPELLAGLVAHESAGFPCAIRVERAFWRRYGAGVSAWVRSSVSTSDDPWLAYPDLVSASYGLAQVMYPVALERGMVLRFPTDLCDPEVNLQAAERQLVWLHRQEPLTEFGLLLRWNGGRRTAYPGLVFAWAERFAGRF